MARDRFKTLSDAPHFYTFTTVNWVHVFHYKDLAEVVLDSIEYMQNNDRITLYGYVIMENHIHIVASAFNLSEQIKNNKSFTARKILDTLTENKRSNLLDMFRTGKACHKTESDFQFWQEGSHPEMILDEAMMRQKLDYIHYNPVRRGYVDMPEHWRYSSARDYAGKEGLIPLNGKNIW